MSIAQKALTPKKFRELSYVTNNLRSQVQDKEIECPICGENNLRIYETGRIQCPFCGWYIMTPYLIASLQENFEKGRVWIFGYQDQKYLLTRTTIVRNIEGEENPSKRL